MSFDSDTRRLRETYRRIEADREEREAERLRRDDPYGDRLRQPERESHGRSQTGYDRERWP